MQAHIRYAYERFERQQRDQREEAYCEAELAREAQRESDRAYCARAMASHRAGESEEAFEMREAEMAAAQYRRTENVNIEICRIFAAAAPRERRAA